MPLVSASHEIDSVTHLGFEKDHDRFALAFQFLGLRESLKNLVHVVAVGFDGLPSERLPFDGEVT